VVFERGVAQRLLGIAELHLGVVHESLRLWAVENNWSAEAAQAAFPSRERDIGQTRGMAPTLRSNSTARRFAWSGGPLRLPSIEGSRFLEFRPSQ
jgi:hypothetical protein